MVKFQQMLTGYNELFIIYNYVYECAQPDTG